MYRPLGPMAFWRAVAMVIHEPEKMYAKRETIAFVLSADKARGLVLNAPKFSNTKIEVLGFMIQTRITTKE